MNTFSAHLSKTTLSPYIDSLIFEQFSNQKSGKGLIKKIIRRNTSNHLAAFPDPPNLFEEFSKNPLS